MVVAAAASGCSYNRFVAQEESDQDAVGAGRESAAAPQRSDSQPGRNDQRLAQQERDVFGQIAESRAKLARSADARADDTGRQRAERRAGAAARHRRELPAAAVERNVQPPDGRAVGDRKPDRRGADALQRARAGVQHARGASSRRTSPPASSVSRSIPCSTRRRRPNGCRASTSAGRDMRTERTSVAGVGPWLSSMR